ncbi:MAG: AMIN domain-containing protein, partial [Candidatus Hydrogenedentota bacterium]
MGSLLRKRKSSIILTTIATILLAGLLSPPAWAAAGIERQKIRMLEILGLDALDPIVIKTAREAKTLYSVDILPGDESVNVVLKLSDLPTYDSYLYEGNRRLVVDLRNTINISPTSEFSLGEDKPVRGVRNSLYKVKPTPTSRVVLDLD